MTPATALFLGIIQGVTEFLPISSSAHLALVRWAFQWTISPTEDRDLLFDVAVHFGTLLALVAYFWRDWLAFIRRRDRQLLYVLAACVPGAVAGALGEEKAETVFQHPLQIAALLAALGLLLAAAERWGKRQRGLETMSWADALWIGLAQALAIMPGVSRAGVTMTAGLARGLTREAATRFSFLLATPILLGAALWSGRHLVGGLGVSASLFGVGMLSAAVTGLLSIHFLLRFLQRHTFYPFVLYRLALAVLVVALFLVRAQT